MDRDKMTGWCIAGACSVAIHVFIILLFVLLGKTSSNPASQPKSTVAARETTPTPPPETPHETDAPASTSSPSEPRLRTYKVKPGDNLSRLARNAHTTPAELARLNGVGEKELANLKVGQIIKLPVAD